MKAKIGDWVYSSVYKQWYEVTGITMSDNSIEYYQAKHYALIVADELSLTIDDVKLSSEMGT